MSLQDIMSYEFEDKADSIIEEEGSENGQDDTLSKTRLENIVDQWKPQPWTHALYHTTTSVLGASAVAALPYSFAYLHWWGGIILLLSSAGVSYYSGVLLIVLQEQHHRTYSELADDIMHPKFSHYFIRPFQLIIFFTVGTITMLLTGQLMQSLQNAWGSSYLQQQAWIVISGIIVLLLALIPTLSQMWQLSLLGTVTAIAASILMIIGSAIAVCNDSREDIDHRKPTTGSTYSYGILVGFGIIAFAFGGHSVLPDIQTSLHCDTRTEGNRAMLRGISGAYLLIVPCYLAVSITGYAAFGSSVSGFLPDDFLPFLTTELESSIEFIILVNGLALGAVYIQAAFTLIEDIFPFLGHHWTGRYNVRQLLSRCFFVALCTFTAAALPFFGDLAALSGAIGFTPLTFIYPFIFWNRVHKDASPWIRRLHTFLAFAYTVIGTCGGIGALHSIIDNASSYKFF